MAFNISKNSNGCSNMSGSLAKTVLNFGLLVTEYYGSGLLVNTYEIENG